MELAVNADAVVNTQRSPPLAYAAGGVPAPLIELANSPLPTLVGEDDSRHANLIPGKVIYLPADERLVLRRC